MLVGTGPKYQGMTVANLVFRLGIRDQFWDGADLGRDIRDPGAPYVQGLDMSEVRG